MPGTKISLSQMEAFCALAKYRSFKEASAKLEISQPSLVNKISHLEEFYNAKLFIRRRENNRLTNLGCSLLPLFKSALNAVREAEHLMYSHSQMHVGAIHIAAVSPYKVSKILKVFNSRYPNIRVKASFSSSENIQRLLELGEVDAAFYVQSGKRPGQQAFRCYEYSLVAILPADHPLANKAELEIPDFHHQGFVSREEGSLTRSLFEEALREEGVAVNTLYELGSRESIREAVGQGLGISVVAEDEHVPHPNIVVRPIRSDRLTTASSLVVLNERVSTPLTQSLIEVVTSLEREFRKGSVALELTS
ncbi:DNA-binding transcriptional regulator, LysR family [Microbulbifer donghaiensis]|uniref:DNA-binding transcriptional regulator, LysR family n=1 Tax=Microbulbifer donghaiensis TaxID=494016 RepID=A0A1M5G3V6_9GAMM|nr:LysR family transcriptional regulator [Microbulbifer donghaiensis]SHF98408.1 DNA-binding transcriptional regulator, LysR family [Microbulbifer donghaiensis]